MIEVEKKIVLDIVLLLPSDVRQFCTDLDRGSERSKEVSFENGYGPHITLSMRCVKVGDVSEITKKIQELVQNLAALDLTIVGFHEGKFSWLDIAKVDALIELHRRVNAIVESFSSSDAIASYFYEGNEKAPEQSLINYVNNFSANSCGENYAPHISMGTEKAFSPEFPIQFKADTVGVFQLGHHGTCKNKIAEFKLHS